jgi:ATP-dependent DNA ligase
MLNNDLSVPVTFVAFDLLSVDCTDLTKRPYEERRHLLASLGLDGLGSATSDTFEDGHALSTASVNSGSRASSRSNSSATGPVNAAG